MISFNEVYFGIGLFLILWFALYKETVYLKKQLQKIEKSLEAEQ